MRAWRSLLGMVLALICACPAHQPPVPEPLPTPSSAPTPPADKQLAPGADRDAHGCIGSAGYQWCARENRCVRVWELEKEKGVTSADEYCAQPASAP